MAGRVDAAARAYRAQLTSTSAAPRYAASRVAYYMRERISQFNSVELQETLDENTGAVLNAYRELRSVPVITISGRGPAGDLPQHR